MLCYSTLKSHFLLFLIIIAQTTPKSSLISFSEKIVESDLENNTRHLVQLKIGEPPQVLKVKLSTAICGIWVYNKSSFGNGYDISKSTTVENIGMNGHVDNYIGKYIKDQIKFWDYTVPSVPILLVDSDGKNNQRQMHDGLLGFGYQCKSKSYGNVDINKLFIENSKEPREDVVSFTLNDTTGKGMIYPGKIPSYVNVTSRHYREVKLDIWNYNGNWEIPIHSVYFPNGDMFLINDNLAVGFGGTFFSVKKEFFEFLSTQYFLYDIENGLCSERKKEAYEILCTEDYDPNKLGTLSVVVGKWNFKLYPEKLFHKIRTGGETRMWCSIVYYPEYNKYYISQKLFTNSTVIYNRKKDVIGIYEHKDINITN